MKAKSEQPTFNTPQRSTIIQYLYGFSIIVLILVFSYTGMIKFVDRNTFTSAMYNQPFSETLTAILIYTLPPMEIITAILLLPARTRFAGLIISLCQLLLFTAYSVMVLSGYYPFTPCACGGFIQHLSWPQHLLFNISLLCLCIAALALHRFQLIQDTRVTGNAENLSNQSRHQ